MDVKSKTDWVFRYGLIPTLRVAKLEMFDRFDCKSLEDYEEPGTCHGVSLQKLPKHFMYDVNCFR